MSESSFHFRYFTVHQDKCAMKVGTDAVLLGSWVRPATASTILDIGTGTGLIALMLAQKSTAIIDAIDVDAEACQQAKENFRISPWFDRLYISQCSLQEFAANTDERYDLIVSNPPYFHASKPAQEARTAARHTEALPFGDLIDGVKHLLRPNGTFWVILPAKEGMEFMDLAQRKGLFCRHLARVRTVADKPNKRLMMVFYTRLGPLTEEEIVVQNDDHSYSEQYIDLTKDYYINLKSALPSSH